MIKSLKVRMKKELIILILLLVFLFGCTEIPEEEFSDTQIVCVNAQSGELCGGLDFVFGEGYGNICCEEFEVCCR